MRPHTGNIDPSIIPPGELWAITPPPTARPLSNPGTWYAARNLDKYHDSGKDWAVTRTDRNSHSRMSDADIAPLLRHRVDPDATWRYAAEADKNARLKTQLDQAQAQLNALPTQPVTRDRLHQAVHDWANSSLDPDELVDTLWRMTDPEQARIEDVARDLYRIAYPGTDPATDADLDPFRRIAAASPTGGAP